MQDKKSQIGPSRADRFWGAFLFTKNGRVKSPLIIYSFSLSIVLLLIYGAAYWFLIDPLHHLLIAAPIWAATLFESLLPALAGCALVCLVHKWSGSKRFIPAAHLWLLLYALLTLFFMLIFLEIQDDRAAFFSLYLRIVPLPVLLGGLSTWLLYRKYSPGQSSKKLNAAPKPTNPGRAG